MMMLLAKKKINVSIKFKLISSMLFIIDKLVASRCANAGAFNLRQIILGTFDQKIHTTGEADTAEIFSSTYREILGIETPPGTNMPANFRHVGGGYDAQYYGYLVSQRFPFDQLSLA